MQNINLNNMYSNTAFGLKRVYSILKANGTITEASVKNNESLNYMDSSFADFLNQNFKSIDKDKNKLISESELNNLFYTIQTQGLTYQQMINMASQSGYTVQGNEALMQVLQKFSQIDKNKDGKVSQSEINAFNATNELEERIAEITEFKVSNISSYYTDEEET